MQGVPVPFEVVVGGYTGKMLGHIAAALVAIWPTMFAFQFLVVCEPLPGVSQILSASEQRYVGARAPRPEDAPSSVDEGEQVGHAR